MTDCSSVGTEVSGLVVFGVVVGLGVVVGVLDLDGDGDELGDELPFGFVDEDGDGDGDVDAADGAVMVMSASVCEKLQVTVPYPCTTVTDWTSFIPIRLPTAPVALSDQLG